MTVVSFLSTLFNKLLKVSSIGLCMQMFVTNILGLYNMDKTLENSLSPAEPA